MSKKSNNPTASAHESLAITVRPIVWWLVALVVLVVATVGLMGLLLRYLSAETPPAETALQSVPMPLPHEFPPLVEDQSLELARTLALARHLLDGYAWQDQAAGVARIPITRAMEILAETGLPRPGETPNEELPE